MIAADREEHLRRTIAALERWGAERGWVGPDPYEGLSAPRLAPLKRSPLGRRVLIQAVKRSPLDLRRPLGIVAGLDAATVAHVLAAHSRLPVGLRHDPDRDLGAGMDALERLRLDAFEEPCWGYHFDVETRFFNYPASTPNTIATAFAGHALLDAHAAGAGEGALELAIGVGRFFCERVGLNRVGEGGYFGYFAGDRTPIHNASLLAGSLLARLAEPGGPEADRFAEAAAATARYALAHQRADGSWPYAEGGRGDWVDGFHTGYVLDALLAIAEALDDDEVGSAWARGLEHYSAGLFTVDGTPRYFIDRTYPIDGQSVAQAIRTFSLASRRQPERLEEAWRTYAFAVERMSRGDGAFIFQRRRLWTNRRPHVRWVQAPMLDALAHLAEVSA
ncbi:MAG: hypothetical protein ACR2K6_01735 [Solirubrobacterales bacterium]